MAKTSIDSKLFVVTGKAVAVTRQLTWSFMMKDDVPFSDYGECSSYFGFVRCKDGHWFANLMTL